MNPKLLGPSELIKQSVEIFKAHYRTFLSISLVGAILSLLIGIGTAQFFGQSGQQFETKPDWLTPGIGLAILVVVLLVVFVSLWLELAIYKAAFNPQMPMGEIFSSVVHKIGPLLVIGLLTGLIILGGFILLIIPGIIFAIWYSLAPIILIDEGTKGWSALKRSRDLVKGHGIDVFLRFLVIVIILIVLSLPARFVFDPNSLVDDIYNAVISLITGPLVALYTVQLYKNLKEIKSAPQISNEPQA